MIKLIECVCERSFTNDCNYAGWTVTFVGPTTLSSAID